MSAFQAQQRRSSACVAGAQAPSSPSISAPPPARRFADADGAIASGTVSFRPSRYDGGGIRYLRFRSWLDSLATDAGGFGIVHFEEVRRHAGTDAAHIYGGLLATLTAWCEQRGIAYQGVPVGTIKRFATGKGNADKAAMIAAIRARGFSPADNNEADALAILLWAIGTGGGVR